MCHMYAKIWCSRHWNWFQPLLTMHLQNNALCLLSPTVRGYSRWLVYILMTHTPLKNGKSGESPRKSKLSKQTEIPTWQTTAATNTLWKSINICGLRWMNEYMNGISWRKSYYQHHQLILEVDGELGLFPGNCQCRIKWALWHFHSG